LFIELSIADCEDFSAFGSSSAKNISASFGFHSLAEAMFFFVLSLF